MKRWCLVVDVEKCENCNNCFLSCKDEHYGNDWPNYAMSQPLHGHRWMNILRKEHGQFPHISVAYKPKPCLHCDDPPCLGSAANGEIYKRDDGIVIIDPNRAKGKKELAEACPFGAIWWNEEIQTAQKCTLCAHLIDGGWERPRCVQSCPTGALSFHHLSDEEFDNFVDSNDLKNYHIGKRVTFDSVLYKNIDLYNDCFIAGSVAIKYNRVEDCVKDAEIRLYKGNSMVTSTITDTFGDFKFEGLKENSGLYKIEIRHDDHDYRHIDVTLKESINIGTIWF